MKHKEQKFTATMTFNVDKELVQDLRNEFDVGEKEIMSFLIHTALQHRDELEARVTDYKTEVQKAKDAKKAEFDEAKAAVRSVREQARQAAKAERDVKTNEVLEVAAKKAKKAN